MRGNSQNGHRRAPIVVGKLFDREPPMSLEAEAAVIGSLMLKPSVAFDIAPLVRADDFASEKNATIYRVLMDLIEHTKTADAVMVNERLRDSDTLKSLGGIGYVLELCEATPHAESAERYARIVHDTAVRRRLIEVAGRILHDTYHPDTDGRDELAPELLERAQSAIFELAESGIASDGMVQSADEALRAAMADVEYRQEHPGLGGLATGFHELDEALDGLRAGQMIIVAARPSIGKSAWALNVAENVAANGYGAAVFSIEMSTLELAKRLLSSRSGVPSNAMQRPATLMGGDDWQSLSRTVERARDLPLYICDTPTLSLERLTSMSRKLVARRDVRLIIVDYVQIMEAPHGDTREREVAGLWRGIKRLARHLRVPILALAQVSREAAKRENPGPPEMGHIRESGAAEQDADVILALHRDDFYRIDADPNAEPDHKAIVAIRKQRAGPRGYIALHFDAQRTRFSNAGPEDYQRWGVS